TETLEVRGLFQDDTKWRSLATDPGSSHDPRWTPGGPSAWPGGGCWRVAGRPGLSDSSPRLGAAGTAGAGGHGPATRLRITEETSEQAGAAWSEKRKEPSLSPDRSARRPHCSRTARAAAKRDGDLAGGRGGGRRSRGRAPRTPARPRPAPAAAHRARPSPTPRPPPRAAPHRGRPAFGGSPPAASPAVLPRAGGPGSGIRIPRGGAEAGRKWRRSRRRGGGLPASHPPPRTPAPRSRGREHGPRRR
ncbi:translation initiation factor IF-2-like, partial [Camelus ferus]|uniref:Translation initiation factor IF-2-like n=1 Tax=Camelus ferus TaxID=419612 RepID=A0A8B8S504_CAMFR